MKYRHNWRRCADKFHAVYELDPTGPWAAAGLYMTGKLYQELYKWSQTSSDLVSAQAENEEASAWFNLHSATASDGAPTLETLQRHLAGCEWNVWGLGQ